MAIENDECIIRIKDYIQNLKKITGNDKYTAKRRTAK